MDYELCLRTWYISCPKTPWKVITTREDLVEDNLSSM